MFFVCGCLRNVFEMDANSFEECQKTYWRNRLKSKEKRHIHGTELDETDRSNCTEKSGKSGQRLF